MSLIEEDTVPIIKTVQNPVYLIRWYILAVFSIVSALQVPHKFYFELIESVSKPPGNLSPRIILIWGNWKYSVKLNLGKLGIAELTFAKSTFYQH